MKRQNNLDFLRLLFSLVVVLVHAYALSGQAQLAVFSHYFNSFIAVQGFFVISGFLITMSYEKSKSHKVFFIKRVRRIYPAYVVVVLLAAIGCVSLTQLDATSYFWSSQTWQYLLANLTMLNFLHPTLPGMFEHNALPAVNGALWSIRIEVFCYALTPFLCVLSRRFGRKFFLAVVYGLSVIGWQWLEYLYQQTGNELYHLGAIELPAQIACYVCGMFIYYHFDIFLKRWRELLTASILMMLASRGLSNTWFYVTLFPPAMAVVILLAAYRLPYLGNFGRFGDVSYGLYIYHFPIIQGLVMVGAFKQSPWTGLLVALTLTLIAAVGSWHLIEKHWLSRTSHYRQATESGEPQSG